MWVRSWYCTFNFLGASSKRRIGAGACQVIFCYTCCFIWWCFTILRRWRKRRFVGFSNAQQSDSKLSVGRDAFQNSVSNFEKFLPVWEFFIEHFDT